MSDTLLYIAEHFKGSFVTPAEQIAAKRAQIKAYIFDWDGVFNNGFKDDNGSSSFSEVDSMGTNMLRYNHYLLTGENPLVAIVSGERNKIAFSFAVREHFHAAYYKIADKSQALEDICKAHNITPQEIAFMFDDVLDLSIAKLCGLRIMVSRQCNPLLLDYAQRNNMVDYITAADGGNHAVREASELLAGLSGKFDETIGGRIAFDESYRNYLAERNAPDPVFYTNIDGTITEKNPL
jgi:3-deoxy-D-manno-octulosonate 8-phosphate phosphatase (KDO 8-P phosphatase)